MLNTVTNVTLCVNVFPSFGKSPVEISGLLRPSEGECTARVGEMSYVDPSNRDMKPLAFLLTLFLGTPFLVAAEQSLDTFTISPGEVTKADVFNGADGQVRLDMALITGKRHEFAEFTQRNLDKQVQLIVNQDVVSEPVIKGQILDGSVELIVPSLEAGHALVKALMSKQPPPEAPEQEPTLGAAPVIKTPRDELVSQLEAAIETHDRAAFERCFNFSGTNQDSRQSALKLEDEIFAWPTNYVCAWERTEKGNMHANVNGKFFTLNGDWTFFIGIYRLQPVRKGLPGSKGFSFPAGIAQGNPFVLLPVEEKS
jgi:hypothetical protein